MELIKKYFGHRLSTQQLQKFEEMQPVYAEWNEKINVISRKDMDAFYERHVLHSLSIAAFFRFQSGQNVIDLGTGGGFPGLPLAIFFPETNFTLVDSTGKKIQVVKNAIEKLSVKNANALHLRAEAFKHKGTFNTIVTRAVAPMEKLVHWSRPLLKRKPDHKGPYGILALKGGSLDNELEQFKNACRVYAIKNEFNLPWFDEKFLIHYMP